MYKRIVEQWRSTTFRLTVFLGVFFALSVAGLLGFIYWNSAVYLSRQVDDTINSLARNYARLGREQLIGQIEYSVAYDARHINLIGLFRSNGEPIVGNLRYIPPEVLIDGRHYRFSYETSLRHVLVMVGDPNAPGIMQPPITRDRINSLNQEQISGVAIAQAAALPSGEVLVIGRDITQLVEVQRVILNALIAGGGGIFLLGLVGAFALSVQPLRRINIIREITPKIMLGDLRLRIPETGRNDELDLLAIALNKMLDEVTRLLGEVKSVTDTIAHDLRTPLTRLRALLYRVSQESLLDQRYRDTIELAVVETDSLLRRFRALLRIAEIENRERRAGFVAVDLAGLMVQLFELFEPLAEEKSVRLHKHIEQVDPIEADPDLLFEALSNLVDNAIKFTPAGGTVELILTADQRGPRIDIVDSGPGIAVNEREAVLHRFYRSDRNSDVEGLGLGLSIASAIMLLHGFKMGFQDVPRGAHLAMYCWPHPLAS